jgi:hypothetical protein
MPGADTDSTGDGRGGRVRRDRTGLSKTGSDPVDDGDGGYSGRVFVTAAVVGVLVLWGGLNLAFRQWRAGYRERADYGVEHVANAIDPLARVVPAGEASPGAGGAGAKAAKSAWEQAVAETHAMLVTLTAANLLDRAQMDDLGGRIAARVAAARPETAIADLAAVWDEAEDRAGPVIDRRHQRPALLPPKAVKEARQAVRNS